MIFLFAANIEILQCNRGQTDKTFSSKTINHVPVKYNFSLQYVCKKANAIDTADLRLSESRVHLFFGNSIWKVSTRTSQPKVHAEKILRKLPEKKHINNIIVKIYC